MTMIDPNEMRREAVRQVREATAEALQDLADRGLPMEQGAPAILGAAFLIEARNAGMTDRETIDRLRSMQVATAQFDPIRKAH